MSTTECTGVKSGNLVW